MSAQPQASDDALNEYLVDHAYRQMMAAPDETAQRHWQDRMRHYVLRRSPERIQRMETELGLR